MEAQSASVTLTGKDDNRDPPEAAVTGGENSRKINGRCMSRLGLKRGHPGGRGPSREAIVGIDRASLFANTRSFRKASGGVNLNLLTHEKQNVIQKAA